ncbi:MAG: polysaccharide deacetylase family protein, partial [Ruminococcus sp.]|nr:polysaccharide deacetylase family protein [Ruminococcus sp.]
MYICINLRKALGIMAVIAAAAIIAVPFIGHIPKSVPADAEPSGVFLPVIMYHSILIEPARQGSYVVSPEQFENDLKWLSDNGWTAVLSDDLIAYTDSGGNLPEKPV